MAMQAGKGANRGLRCGALAAFMAVSTVEQVEFICGVAVGGIRNRVPGAGRGPGADGLAFGMLSACQWCGHAAASIK